MSNVRITATGDEALSVEVLLGDQNRAWRDLEAGESADLAVGGNQTLRVGPAREAPSVFVTPDDEPAGTTPWVTGDDGADVPIGVDVQAEDEGRDVIATVPGEAEVGAVNTEDDPAPEFEVGAAGEAQVIGAGDVGDIAPLFGGDEVGGEAAAETSVINDLKADSPLEVGSLSDLPSPFDVDSGESTEGVIEEAEDTDEKAQA